MLYLPHLYETVKFDIIGTVLDYNEIPDLPTFRDHYTNISILNNQLYILLDHREKSTDVFINTVIDNINTNISDLQLYSEKCTGRYFRDDDLSSKHEHSKRYFVMKLKHNFFVCVNSIDR